MINNEIFSVKEKSHEGPTKADKSLGLKIAEIPVFINSVATGANSDKLN